MSESLTTAQDGNPPGGRWRGRAGAWGGYIWFMSLGTLLPLPVFLCGYLAQLTFVGAPLARLLYRFGVFLSTLGQSPPGADKLAARRTGRKKKPFAERIRDRAPPGWVARRRTPFGTGTRAAWFVFVGWWLGALWTGLAWSVLLLPYPFPALIRSLLNDLPSVMTLAPPG